MTDPFQDSGQQPRHSQGSIAQKLEAELNKGLYINVTAGSSNPSSSYLDETRRTSATRPSSKFRDYVNNEYFNSLVSIVKNASEDFLPSRVPWENMEAKQLVAVFERVRRHAVHRKLTTMDEAILFAVADIFTSGNRVSSWYGPKLISRMLSVGNLRVRYLILRLMWNAFSADMRFNMSTKSSIQFLEGLFLIVQKEAQLVGPLRNATEDHPIIPDKEDEMARQTLKSTLNSKQTEWFLLQRNLLIAFKIIRLFSRNDRIRDSLHKNEQFLSIVDSFLSNPMAPKDAFCECLFFVARSEGFLGILDKREPLGTVPQVVMHIAEYCMVRIGPSWSVPRFLTKENVSIETFQKTSGIAFAAVKSYAASIERESLFFEPLCDSIMRMYISEALNDVGTIIGRALGTLISRFPSRVPLKDEFIAKIISGIHSSKEEIADLVDTLLYAMVDQYPKFMQKHGEAISEARFVRKLLRDTLDGTLSRYPELPEDFFE